MSRLWVVALCLAALSCADAVEGDARRTYELTLPAPSDGSGWSISRDGNGTVATWQIRIDDSWDKYAEWVRPRLLKEFDSVTEADTQRLRFGKSLAGDMYALELRYADPPQGMHVTATFTARPF